MLSIEYKEDIPVLASKDIISSIYSSYPHMIYLLKLEEGDDNIDIVDFLSEHPLFEEVFEDNLIELYEDCSFDYDYGSISSTHICYAHVGYTLRTECLEERIFEEMGYLDY